VMVETATGAWTLLPAYGIPQRLGPSTVLLEEGTLTDDGDFRPGDLTVYDVDRRRTLRTVGRPVTWLMSLDERTLYTLAADATLSLWDTADWTVRGTARAPITVGDWAGITVSDRVLTVRTGSEFPQGPIERGDLDTVSGSIDLRSLLPTTETVDRHVFDCGEVVCGYDIGSEGVSVLSDETGEVLWRPATDLRLQPTGDGALVVESQLQEAGPMVISMVDPLTGAMRADLRGWLLLTDGFGEVLANRTSYLLRPDRLAGTGYLARLAPGGRVDPLGPLRFDVRQCSGDGSYLGCSDIRGTIHLLRVR
jgi:hypothetical protein